MQTRGQLNVGFEHFRDIRSGSNDTGRFAGAATYSAQGRRSSAPERMSASRRHFGRCRLELRFQEAARRHADQAHRLSDLAAGR